jgi:hypothetical protein
MMFVNLYFRKGYFLLFVDSPRVSGLTQRADQLYEHKFKNGFGCPIMPRADAAQHICRNHVICAIEQLI